MLCPAKILAIGRPSTLRCHPEPSRAVRGGQERAPGSTASRAREISRGICFSPVGAGFKPALCVCRILRVLHPLRSLQRLGLVLIPRPYSLFRPRAGINRISPLSVAYSSPNASPSAARIAPVTSANPMNPSMAVSPDSSKPSKSRPQKASVEPSRARAGPGSARPTRARTALASPHKNGWERKKLLLRRSAQFVVAQTRRGK